MSSTARRDHRRVVAVRPGREARPHVRGPHREPFRQLHQGGPEGRRGDLNADILEGHQSTALCHVGNISHRLGRPERVEVIARRLEDSRLDAEAGRTFERMTQASPRQRRRPGAEPAVPRSAPAHRFRAGSVLGPSGRRRLADPRVSPPVRGAGGGSGVIGSRPRRTMAADLLPSPRRASRSDNLGTLVGRRDPRSDAVARDDLARGAGPARGDARRLPGRGAGAARPAHAGLHRQPAAGRGRPPRRRAARRPRPVRAPAMAGELAPPSRLPGHPLGRAASLPRPARRALSRTSSPTASAASCCSTATAATSSRSSRSSSRSASATGRGTTCSCSRRPTGPSAPGLTRPTPGSSRTAWGTPASGRRR